MNTLQFTLQFYKTDKQTTCYGLINSFGRIWVALKRAVLFDREAGQRNLLGLLGLLGQEHSLDVGQYTSLGDGHTGEQFVQLLIVADGQLQVTGDDPGLLVVTGGVSCQLQNFGGQVLHDGSQVDWGTGTNALSIVSLAEMTVDTSHGELKSSPG